jgi:aminoglycoside/choline kinase family phosphotransferase
VLNYLFTKQTFYVLMKEYIRNPELEEVKLAKNYVHPEKGLFFYFRHMCMKMQRHFTTLIDHEKLPQVFLHGNPHTENYIINEQGSGMVDFDRSCTGAYAWDIVRFLCSLSLKRMEATTPFLSQTVLEYFREGYLRGFEAHRIAYKEVSKTVDKARHLLKFGTTAPVNTLMPT